jgi:glycosyltransferase involved in cell wall biosynthesis
MTMQFSILVPTRDRPATLRATLASLTQQSGNDFEVVVADNAGSASTKAVVEEFQAQFPFVRYLRSDEILPMADNWERGLAACVGNYVTILGDDDGFLPSTLAMARKLINVTQAKLIAWEPHVYWWPDTIVYWNANRVVAHLANNAISVNSREMLVQFFAGVRSFAHLPMIYNAFVHRTVVEQCRQRWGRYFLPKNLAPDITSGVVNLMGTENFVFSYRGLSIRGNSGKSNGTAQWARSLGVKQREAYFADERKTLAEIMHPDLIVSPHLQFIIANCKLHCRELFFPNDPAIQVSLPVVVETMIAGLPQEPESYDENLRDALAFAEKIGYAVDKSKIPPKVPVKRGRPCGPISSQSLAGKVISSIVIDGDLANVADVAAAGRLIDALLPKLDTYPSSG